MPEFWNKRSLSIKRIMKELIPNVFSGYRIIVVPFLLYSAWMGYKNLFLVLLVISLLSDAIVFFGYIKKDLKRKKLYLVNKREEVKIK